MENHDAKQNPLSAGGDGSRVEVGLSFRAPPGWGFAPSPALRQRVTLWTLAPPLREVAVRQDRFTPFPPGKEMVSHSHPRTLNFFPRISCPYPNISCQMLSLNCSTRRSRALSAATTIAHVYSGGRPQ